MVQVYNHVPLGFLSRTLQDYETETGTITSGTIILTSHQCARGSTSLESFHLHLQRFIPGTSANSLNFQLYLLEGLSRWNQDRAAASTTSQPPTLLTYGGDIINSINTNSLKVFGRRYVASFQPPAKYTGELIGVNYLLRQTGQPLQEVNPESEDTDNLLDDMAEDNGEEDEGFQEEDVLDPKMSSLGSTIVQNDQKVFLIESAVGPPVQPAIQQNVSAIQTTVKQAVQPPLSSFQQAVQPPLSSFQQAVQPPLSSFQEAMQPPLSSFQEAVQPPLSSFQQAVQPPLSSFQQAVQPPLSSVQQAVQPPLSSVQQAVQPPLSSVQQAVQPPLSSVQPPMSSVQRAVQPPVLLTASGAASSVLLPASSAASSVLLPASSAASSVLCPTGSAASSVLRPASSAASSVLLPASSAASSVLRLAGSAASSVLCPADNAATSVQPIVQPPLPYVQPPLSSVHPTVQPPLPSFQPAAQLPVQWIQPAFQPILGIPGPADTVQEMQLAVDEHGMPGMDRVDSLAEFLVELGTHNAMTLSNQEVSTIVAWS
ncbi:proline-rich protein 36-like [Notolabrus celidotus]|uniref:proline-rich protein 36-like n=1 Tax=Notolabrus celidotus TaxID=1203425 RepID=UPI00148F7065|nr:proline-rich protein 36-like [Notolabrus celidotus]